MQIAADTARSRARAVVDDRRQQQQAGNERADGVRRRITRQPAHPSDRRLHNAHALNGSRSGQDMWSCMTEVSPAPIIRKAIAGRSQPIDQTGTASKKPMKNSTAPASTYDGLVMCVENCSVHGTVMNHPQTSHRGSDGRRRVMYHASMASAANDSRFSRTNGASGHGATRSGSPTSRPCSAPGISLFVQTTSAPKNGQWPVA